MFNLWGNLLLFVIFIMPKFSASADCGAPNDYPNTRLRIPNGKTAYSSGDLVFYNCALGYMRVSGFSSVRCEEGGWTRLKMRCERKPCGSAGEIYNGHFDYMGLEAKFGDEVAAVCSEGYRLKGNRYRRCQDSGWSGEIPSCEEGTEITCRTPSVANGVKIKGQAPVYNRGNRVTFNCTRGFSLNGSREITCGPNGQWHPKIPKCLPANEGRKITCRTPSVANGVKIKGQAPVYNRGNRVTFNCTRGFSLNGSREITCGPNGQWHPKIPKCLPANGNFATLATVPSMKPTDADLLKRGNCSAPTTFPHMYLTEYLKEFPPGTEVRYRCFPGYRGIMAISRCVSGRWTPINLKCERKSCGSAGEILNGRYEYKGVLFGDTVSAVCNEGYEMIGRNYRQCQDQGWDGNAPVCEAVKCGDLPEVVNGERTGPQEGPFIYSTVIHYRCRQGQLIGDREIYCMQDGTWSASPPQCRSSRRDPADITCRTPSVANGVKIKGQAPVYNRGNRVTFNCTRGFSLNGSREITCGPNGQWHPKIPKCLPANGNFATLAIVPSMKPTDADLLKRGSCGAPTTYPHMYLTDQYLLQTEFPPGTEVRYRCFPGYRGIMAISRCVSGRWTPIHLKCERKSCGSAGEILNGHYEYNGILFGDTVSAVCNEGYEMIGHNYRQCQDQGWDGNALVCEAVKCGDLPEVVNGERTGPQEGPFIYSTMIYYWCKQGQLIGDREIYCMQNGTWSAPPPECKDIRCTNPYVKFGTKTGGYSSNYKYRDFVSFKCNKGYRLSGLSKVTCGLTGQWTPSLPKCKVNYCPALSIPNARYTNQKKI